MKSGMLAAISNLDVVTADIQGAVMQTRILLWNLVAVFLLSSLPGLPPSWIGEHGIGLIDLLKPIFSNRIIAVEIWMPAAGFRPKGTLQGGSIGPGTQAED